MTTLFPTLVSPLNPTIASWHGQRVWVVGASSGIGAAIARQLLTEGARVALSARSEDSLQRIVDEAPRPASSVGVDDPGRVQVLPLDIIDSAAVAEACAKLRERWAGLDLVIWVAGTHSEMRASDFDLAQARRLMQVNFDAVLGGLDCVLPMLLEQGRGGLALVSSVAGYRGLPKALVYGPSKAALINLAESLYFDLQPRGIGVYLVNPGFVATPLTARNTFKMPALISAEEAARASLAGIAAGRFEIHYPRRFTRWLKLARLMPYRLYFAALRRVTGL